jgi:fatty-acyl-CoA synthase
MEFPVPDWVAHHARTRPTTIALRRVDTGESRTWLELERRVGSIAHAFSEEFGLGRGDCLAVISSGDVRSFELQFACMRIGAVFAPLNFRLALPELVNQCLILKPRLIITDADWEDVAKTIASQVGIKELLSWGTGPGSEFDTLACSAHALQERRGMNSEEVTLVLFTSGTTGVPKGATTTLGAMVWQAINQIEFARVAEEGAHVLSPLPLFHAGGLHSLCNPILFFGGQVSICDRFDPAACVTFAGNPANRVTHMSLVPIMYQMMADVPEFEHADFSSMRAALVAGGRVSERLRDQYAEKGVNFSSQYGATETGPTVTALNPLRVDKLLKGSCGQKVLSVDLRLVNSDGDDVKVDEPGEIWVRGPAVTKRYLNRDPALDFWQGWFRSGDIATVDDEGFLYLVGRAKEMYKSGGENVYPFEVESILSDHPDIAEVSVIGVPDEKWGEVGLAVAVPKAGRTLTLESIRRHCEGRIARYKHPHALEILEVLPRGPMNKIAKDALRLRFGGRRA